MEEGNPSLEMRADNAVRQLRRDGDIEDYLDAMENTLAVAKRMLSQGMIPQERVDKFNDGYLSVLTYYIDNQEAPSVGYKSPRRAKDIDLSEEQ